SIPRSSKGKPTSCAPPFRFLVDDTSRDAPVVEIVTNSVDLLIRFVTFAGDQNDVFLLRHEDGLLNRSFSVLDDFVVAPRETFGGVVENFPRILGAWIVGGKNAIVAPLLRRLRHGCPL